MGHRNRSQSSSQPQFPELTGLQIQFQNLDLEIQDPPDMTKPILLELPKILPRSRFGYLELPDPDDLVIWNSIRSVCYDKANFQTLGSGSFFGRSGSSLPDLEIGYGKFLEAVDNQR